MTQMPKEKMTLYQRNRRKGMRSGETVTTVAGVLSLVRKVEERVVRLEEWVKEVDEMGESKP